MEGCQRIVLGRGQEQALTKAKKETIENTMIKSDQRTNETTATVSDGQ
jgi:hypothetical protein